MGLDRSHFDAADAICFPDGSVAVIARLVATGAEAVVLGCTELMLLVKPADSAVPLFDTTAPHAKAAISMALGELG